MQTAADTTANTGPTPPEKRRWSRVPRTLADLHRAVTPVDRAFCVFGGPEGLSELLSMRLGVTRSARTLSDHRTKYDGFFPADLLADMRELFRVEGYAPSEAFLTKPGRMPAPVKMEG